ncbi:OPT superfamily oligopeptide transporter [Hypoxylon sp. NC1633]|nr:OPT superfamily oligopeptide transporter [Hypoxylon sp. NC1633]
MAPDRGTVEDPPPPYPPESEHVRYLPEGRHFTLRGVAAGLLVGLIICFSNMYFGLQTGWISMMTMPSSLLGFGIFKALSRHLAFPFSPVENVLVQSVAGGMAIMPLGCGFVGVLPAMEYLLEPSEQGPINLSMWKLIIWSLGLCYFGVVFAVPLRRQVIIREQLKFPSGFSTAVLIGVLHGKGQAQNSGTLDTSKAATFGSLALESHPILEAENVGDESGLNEPDDEPPHVRATKQYGWGSNIRLLLITFGISGFYTLCTYFFPVLRNLPIFGTVAANAWLWTLNPSFAYVGQGIIMGPSTTLHMLLGAVIGWAILSPLAKIRGWAPGLIDDWDTGSKGWIVWTSLAIMLADAVVSLGYVAFAPLLKCGPSFFSTAKQRFQQDGIRGIFSGRSHDYTVVEGNDDSRPSSEIRGSEDIDNLPSPAVERRNPFDTQLGQPQEAWDQDDAPPEQLVGNKTVGIGLVVSVLICIASIHITFGDLVPLYATIIAVLMAMILSIMGVRALGETDLNPVSGISKLAQLFFALIIPQSHKSSVLINLVAGAVSEAGALQAGDLMQDLKTGHLLGAAPKAQFWGQIIGATVGAVVSALIYRLYTAVYDVPGDLFQVPTALVWIKTARLVTGKELPYMAREFAIGFAVIFAVFTAIRAKTIGKKWHPYIPGGIAVAVGMYNVPSFTLARTIGGLISWYWRAHLRKEDTPLIVVASGFILGEGFLSIINLLLESSHVRHL